MVLTNGVLLNIRSLKWCTKLTLYNKVVSNLRSRLYERNWFTSRPYHKSDCSFNWLHKIVSSSVNKNLNYESGLTYLVNWLVHFAGPNQVTLVSLKWVINRLGISYKNNVPGLGRSALILLMNQIHLFAHIP